MSLIAFGTGVLGALNKGFDKLAEDRAEQAKMTAEQDSAMERLGFARDTSLMTAKQEAVYRQELEEALAGRRAGEAKITRAHEVSLQEMRNAATRATTLATDKKNNDYIGPDEAPYFKLRRSADDKEQIRYMIEGLSNETQLQAALSDTNTRQVIERKIASVVSVFPKTFGEKTVDAFGNVKTLTSPKASVYFAANMKQSPTLMRMFKEAELYKYYPTNDKHAITQSGYQGSLVKQTASPELRTALDAAINSYSNARKPDDPVVLAGRDKAEQRHKFMTINNIYTNNKKDRKYIYFGANKDLMQVLQGSSSNVKPELIDRAAAWLTNPDNGFAEVNELGEVTGLNDAFYTAYEMYGNSNSYARGNHVIGNPIPGNSMSKMLSSDSGKLIAKKIERVNAVQDAASQAYRTINNLIRQTEVAGTGSGALIAVQTFLGALPDLVRDEIPGIFKSHKATVSRTRRDKIIYRDETVKDGVTGKVKYTYKHLNSDGSSEERSAKTVGERISNAFNIVENDKANASARIEALQIILAYQMTSILQGGTGGRTISDQDITRTLKLFSGNVLNKNQKLAKLYYLRTVIQDTLNKGRLYGPVSDPRNNEARWNTLVRTEALINRFTGGDYDIHNIDTRITNKLNKRVIDEPYNNLISPLTPGSVINLIGEKNPDSSFKGANFKQWAENLIRPITGKPATHFRVLEDLNSGRKFIYDYDSRDLILNAKDNKAKRKNIIDKQVTNFVYEVDTNKPLKIKWDENDPNAGFVIIDEAEVAATLKRDPRGNVIPGEKARLTIPAAKTKLFSKGNVPTPGHKPLVHFTEGGERLPYKLEEFPDDSAYVNEVKATRLLKQLGYSEAGIQAILFNIEKEGGFNQNKLGIIAKVKGQFGSKTDETNVGAFQWKGPRLDSYIKWAKDKAINNLGANLLYMDRELQGGEEGGGMRKEYAALHKLLKEKTQETLPWEQLAHEFARVYLRPAKENLERRGVPIKRNP